MVRTRTDAAGLVTSGHVRVNAQRITAPAHAVRIGDVVTLALDRSVRIVEVTGFCERRGSAPEAAATFRMVQNGAA